MQVAHELLEMLSSSAVEYRAEAAMSSPAEDEVPF